MISVLLNSSNEKELNYIEECMRFFTARASEDVWEYHGFSRICEMMEYLDRMPILDIACVDITLKDGVDGAKRIRRLNQNTFILIISDCTIPPTDYIRPDIMACSLLLRPFNGKQAQSVIKTVIRSYLEKYVDCASQENVFVIDNREGKQLIPYDRITYFEAREKKIVAVTDSTEYSFYDTIDSLEKELPKQFVRSHRGFIVNCRRVSGIIASKNIICLDDGGEIPLSRSYKNVFKDIKV